jgi:hypothetical protein
VSHANILAILLLLTLKIEAIASWRVSSADEARDNESTAKKPELPSTFPTAHSFFFPMKHHSHRR